ncbi:hypothetical protein ACFX12_043371 [Malus domestica]
MLRNPAVVTQVVSCTARRRHHQGENCDQKTLHSEASLQSLAQHHTVVHHRGKTMIKRHYTAKPRCSLFAQHHTMKSDALQQAPGSKKSSGYAMAEQ